MTTISTTLPFFNKPGPMRDFLEERGLRCEWFSKAPAEGKPELADAIKAVKEHAAEMEYFFADTTPLDKEFFAAAKKLKLVAMFGVGLDHIDIQAATERGVIVTNVPGGNARCVAEFAVAMMMDLTHKVTQMHITMTQGQWRPRMCTEISGKTLGIVGLGHIGRDVARLVKGFGMNVIAANRTPRPEIAKELGLTQVPLDEVLEKADYVSLHIPGGPDSWHFGAKEFAKMKKGAFFINTARGDLVDLDALYTALKEDRIAGAGLDVFPQEPMDPSHPIFTLPQVVATPHAGSMSREAMNNLVTSCLDEFVRAVKKQRSPNARNSQVYDMPGWEGFAG
ncbi:phosphoglycerate dehydrogenase [Desulfovibrio sp. OttesenSCG-928-O18]|nr:phosphoglycerate dehydrogenase [Desulfovibrio sp. OttesenSCG-928-O18]